MSKRLPCFFLAFIIVIGLISAVSGCNEPSDKDEPQKEEVTQTLAEPDKITEKPALKPDTEPPVPAKQGPLQVLIDTSMGQIVVELNAKKAPITCNNFMRYVHSGFYDGLVFHRVIPGFMIQGGGFDEDMNKKQTNMPIRNESFNGLKNYRGTLAMARTNNPHSATSQFFINVKDNSFLDYSSTAQPGYAVFGKVVKGMDVVDEIVAVPTTVKNGLPDNPIESVIIKSITAVPAL